MSLEDPVTHALEDLLHDVFSQHIQVLVQREGSMGGTLKQRKVKEPLELFQREEVQGVYQTHVLHDVEKDRADFGDLSKGALHTFSAPLHFLPLVDLHL